MPRTTATTKSKSKPATRKPAAPSSLTTSHSAQDARNTPKHIPISDPSTITSTETEGPTLPIIGERHSKKRRTEDAAPPAAGPGLLSNTGATTATTTTQDKAGEPQQKSRADNAVLYEPWVLLPAALRSLLAARFGVGVVTPSSTSSSSSKSAEVREIEKEGSTQRLADVIIPVVFTKNQNIRSGVNKLRGYLTGNSAAGEETENEKRRRKALGEGKAVLAVSAQGEGTTKLVGIVEMVRRVITPPPASAKDSNIINGENMEVDAKVDEWFIYTSLSHQQLPQPHRKKDSKQSSAAQVDEEDESSAARDEEDETFQSLAEIQQKDRESRKGTRKVPVLTIWFSRESIEVFREAFGEEVVSVFNCDSKEEG